MAQIIVRQYDQQGAAADPMRERRGDVIEILEGLFKQSLIPKEKYAQRRRSLRFLLLTSNNPTFTEDYSLMESRVAANRRFTVPFRPGLWNLRLDPVKIRSACLLSNQLDGYAYHRN